MVGYIVIVMFSGVVIEASCLYQPTTSKCDILYDHIGLSSLELTRGFIFDKNNVNIGNPVNECDGGWTEPCITVDTSRHCYEIFDTRSTWKNASVLCKYYGGNLVTIESVEEQKFIEDLMKNRTFNAEGLWIGSDKLHPEEQRAWANGEKFSYVNWAPGEPNSPLIDENCVEISTDDGTWNDAPCAKRNGYICENSDTENDTCWIHLSHLF